MAYIDLLKLFYIARPSRAVNAHARKAGPGRMPPNKVQGPRRLETRTKGGNWQGVVYLSYAEHDAATRRRLPMVYDAATRQTYNQHRKEPLFQQCEPSFQV